MEEAKRVADLLCGQVKQKDICEIVGVGLTTIKRVNALLKVGKTIKRKAGSGGHNLKITEEFLSELCDKIEEDPTRSMSKLPKDLNVGKATISKAVGILGLHSYVRRRRQLLTTATKKQSVIRGKKLINWMKKKGPSTVLVFSDKKNWTVDQTRNARNDHFLAFSVDDVPPVNQTKYPASAMMLGVVASDGKRMPPFWFPKGLRVGAKEYQDVLKDVVKPWLDANYPDGNYHWQQDSAPGHKAKTTQQWCKDHLANFWPADFWPPSSTDCAPLDYGIWGYVESKTCATPHKSVDDLKASVEQEWANMSEDHVMKVCQAFRPRLEAMVAVDGGHFEK